MQIPTYLQYRKNNNYNCIPRLGDGAKLHYYKVAKAEIDKYFLKCNREIQRAVIILLRYLPPGASDIEPRSSNQVGTYRVARFGGLSQTARRITLDALLYITPRISTQSSVHCQTSSDNLPYKLPLKFLKKTYKQVSVQKIIKMRFLNILLPFLMLVLLLSAVCEGRPRHLRGNGVQKRSSFCMIKLCSFSPSPHKVHKVWLW